MTNVDALKALQPVSRPKPVTDDELEAVLDARRRGISWAQIWAAGEWPYATQGSFTGAINSMCYAKHKKPPPKATRNK
jgi:hypothetical protein